MDEGEDYQDKYQQMYVLGCSIRRSYYHAVALYAQTA